MRGQLPQFPTLAILVPTSIFILSSIDGLYYTFAHSRRCALRHKIVKQLFLILT